MEIIRIYYLTLEDDIPFYIGKTYTTLQRRLYTHWWKYKNKKIQICLIDEVSIKEWKFWECFWIEQFIQWGFKLENKNKGGGGSTKWTKKQKENTLRKQKLSKLLKGKTLGHKGYFKGKKHKETTKQKMSMAHKGISLSEEHKINISNSMKGHSKNKKWKDNLSKSSTKSFGRPILQIDLKGNLIKEWESGKLASKKLNLGYIAINNCCRRNNSSQFRKRDKIKVGKYTSFGYIWEYKKLK